jgi:hypothetical protein
VAELDDDAAGYYMLTGAQAVVRLAFGGERSVEDIRRESAAFAAMMAGAGRPAPRNFLAELHDITAQKVYLAKLGWVRFIECQAAASTIVQRDAELAGAARRLTTALATEQVHAQAQTNDPRNGVQLNSSLFLHLRINMDGDLEANPDLDTAAWMTVRDALDKLKGALGQPDIRVLFQTAEIDRLRRAG